jgi:hypothetical protein
MSEVQLQVGIIYMIDSYDPEIKGYYVGSTLQEFEQRRMEHKSNCNNDDSKEYNHYKYVYIRDNGGWNNFKMTIIERVLVESKSELLMMEQDWQDMLKPNLNIQRAYRTLEDKKNQKAKADQIYKQKNKAILNQKKKEIINCDRCDKTYTKSHKATHQKSKYCINYNLNKSV